jgi:hypothetical protein
VFGGETFYELLNHLHRDKSLGFGVEVQHTFLTTAQCVILIIIRGDYGGLWTFSGGGDCVTD